MRPRTLARRLAFQYLYQHDLTAADCEELSGFLAEHAEHPDTRSFAEELVTEVLARREAIDVRLHAGLRNFELSRVGAVERSILRLGAGELLIGAEPVSVVINEAVNMAKAFGGKDSGSFINGVLDNLARASDAPPAEAPVEPAADTPAEPPS